MMLGDFLAKKGAEYAPFDPNRTRRIYEVLRLFVTLPNIVVRLIGTNGKGSTGRFITLGLAQSGLTTLHFTSPHLFNFNERFYKNGAIISDEKLEEAHRYLQDIDCIKEASYFEYATFLALILSQDCDALILEAGLGGEFDSTSVVESNLCVFTPISFDHEEMLGNSISDIATTKLRAMGKCNIIAPQEFNEVKEIAKRIAMERGAELIFVDRLDEIYSIHSPYNPSELGELNKYDCAKGVASIDSSMSYRGALERYAQSNNLAPFLKENLQVAYIALDKLYRRIDFDRLARFDLIGRAQQITPNILIDVGHNEGCAKVIKKIIEPKCVKLVYNTFFQKNVRRILGILKPNIDELLILDVKNDRILPKSELIAVCDELGIKYSDFKGIQEDLEYVVFGSFSVVKEFLERGQCKIG